MQVGWVLLPNLLRLISESVGIEGESVCVTAGDPYGV